MNTNDPGFRLAVQTLAQAGFPNLTDDELAELTLTVEQSMPPLPGPLQVVILCCLIQVRLRRSATDPPEPPEVTALRTASQSYAQMLMPIINAIPRPS